MIDLVIVSIVLSSLSAIGVGIMAIARRIKKCKSCCCTMECDDDKNEEKPIVTEQPISLVVDDNIISIRSRSNTRINPSPNSTPNLSPSITRRNINPLSERGKFSL